MHSNRWLRILLANLALAAVYYGMARLGLMLAFESTNVSPLWPPSGIALAALLLVGRHVWPGVMLGAFSANLVVFLGNGQLGAGAALATSLAIAAGNTIEALVAAWLLQRLAAPAHLLGKPEHTYPFVGATAFAAAAAALIGTTSLLWAGIVSPSAVPMIAATWWVGDLAGMLIVVPLLLAWRAAPAPRVSGRLRAGAELLALLAVLVALLYQPPDGGQRIWLFALLVCVGWAALRYGRRSATLVVLVVAGASVLATTQGLGPFAAGSRNEALFGLEVFIGLFSTVGILLAADAETRARRDSGLGGWLHWAVLAGTMLLTLVAWQYVTEETEQRAAERFRVEIEEARRRVADRIDAYAQILHSGRALLTATPGLVAAGWGDFVRAVDVDKKYPGFQVLGVARRVRDRAALERQMHAAGYPEYAIWPAGQRESYVAVVMVEPFAGRNLRAFGFDMNSEPVRRAALTRAMQSDALAVSGKLTLVQEVGNDRQAGFLMYLPVYRRGAPHATAEQRHAAVESYVYGAFRMNDLMRGILGAEAPAVSIELFDGVGTTAAARMFASAPAARSVDRAAAAYAGTTSVAVGDTFWTLRVSSLPAFESAIDRAKGLIVLFAGTLIALLLFGMMRALRQTSEDALALATSIKGALRQSEHRFAILVDSASEFSIIATDLDGVIEVFSVGAERMLGYDANELVGVASPALLHEPDELAARALVLSAELGEPVAGFEVLVAKARRGHAETGEWTYRRKDGARLPVQLTVSAIRDAEGAVIGFLGIARDITEQKRIDQDLRVALTRADAGSRAKGEFVANMSHELRTPLNAVLGMAQLLQRTALNDGQRRDVDVIRSAGAALLAILNDILDFSKIEAGKMALACMPLRLEDVAASLATMMSLNAREKPLVLTISLDAALPPVLLGDALRLQQVLVNLAGNAVKFTEHGHVAVRLRSAGRRDDTVTLEMSIQDSGIGMNAEQLDGVFSEFAQADSSTTRRFGGTGLGLAISRRLVAMMGGQIAVTSALGAGSDFVVSLPLAVAPADAVGAVSALPALRVLVADSAAASAAVLGAALAALGCHAAMLAPQRGGVAAAVAAAAPAQVVLLDLGLAGDDPAALIETLRGGTKCAVVLMLSAYERAVFDFDPAALGADAVLDKPVTPAPLRSCLAAILARKGGGGGAAGARAAPAPSVTLLLVEDNLLNQAVGRRLLEAAGARVEIAGNGQIAVDMLRADPGRFALVLLDIQMPVMDGFQAIALIRGELALDLPVLAMTAGVMEHERERCIAAGMNGFIAKPLDAERLLEEIARHLPPADAAPAAAPPDAAAGDADGVFDVSSLVDEADADDGNARIMASLIGALVDAGSGELDQVADAWREQRLPAAARTLHGLRGSIGSLGAWRFAAAALALERALHATPGDHARLDQLLLSAQAELGATLHAAAAWLARRRQPAAAAAVAGDELSRLGLLLGERNLAACELFARIEPGLAPLVGAEVAQQLRLAMRVLDFESAAALLAGDPAAYLRSQAAMLGASS
ncbi:CHASE domain-containing protein [Massilia sp. TWR1-2-2]|uniref:CHASE domain-containing protein n=1 Tax=Massilia sp. TWR1-2-2 TaxID=2804584 RepID=UPI003CF314B2